MSAATNGHEGCVELLLPVSDALCKDKRGMTALMRAACNRHEGCVGLLLPASNALTQDEKGLTALMGAAYYGHEGCVGLLLPVSDALTQALFIDTYAQAQSERAALGVAAGPGAPLGRAAFRM